MSLAVRETEARREVADETGKFKFFLYAKAAYRIRDVGYVFVHKIDIDAMVYNTLYEIFDGIHRKYSIEEQTDMEDELKEQLRNGFNRLGYLDILESDIQIDVDERAREIIDSNLNTMAKSVVRQNEEDIASFEIEQRKRLEKQKYEAEKEVQEKKNALQLEKIKGFNAAKQEAGENYGLVLAYINGEIGSVELDDRLQINEKSGLMTRIEAFKQLVDLEVISGPALEQAALKLLGENASNTETESKALIGEAENENVIVVEDSEEY